MGKGKDAQEGNIYIELDDADISCLADDISCKLINEHDEVVRLRGILRGLIQHVEKIHV